MQLTYKTCVTVLSCSNEINQIIMSLCYLLKYATYTFKEINISLYLYTELLKKDGWLTNYRSHLPKKKKNNVDFLFYVST